MTFTVTITEKGSPELELIGLRAKDEQSAKRQAVANAIVMRWKHPRVIRCKEETAA